ncbi:hypothetical protein OKW40_001738 [Paraburkholderia sp. RAU6.4a]
MDTGIARARGPPFSVKAKIFFSATQTRNITSASHTRSSRAATRFRLWGVLWRAETKNGPKCPYSLMYWRRDGDPKQRIIAARQCDDSIASWLQSPWEADKIRLASRNRHVRLWCVTINIPADQLLDFDKDGIRSYKDGYSEFIGTRPAAKT